MRPIDADRLIEDMGASCLPIMVKGISEITGDESCIVDHINASPTIDAVPVVRCKDCKHWGTGVSGEIEGIKCCKIAGYMVAMSGYCVYGEKSEEDTDELL